MSCSCLLNGLSPKVSVHPPENSVLPSPARSSSPLRPYRPLLLCTPSYSPFSVCLQAECCLVFNLHRECDGACFITESLADLALCDQGKVLEFDVLEGRTFFGQTLFEFFAFRAVFQSHHQHDTPPYSSLSKPTISSFRSMT